MQKGTHDTLIATTMTTDRIIKFDDGLLFCQKVIDGNAIIFHVATDFTFCAHDLDNTRLLTGKAAHTECRRRTVFKFHIDDLMIDDIIVMLIDTPSIIRFLKCLDDSLVGIILGKFACPAPSFAKIIAASVKGAFKLCRTAIQASFRSTFWLVFRTKMHQ